METVKLCLAELHVGNGRAWYMFEAETMAELMAAIGRRFVGYWFLYQYLPQTGKPFKAR